MKDDKMKHDITSEVRIDVRQQSAEELALEESAFEALIEAARGAFDFCFLEP